MTVQALRWSCLLAVVLSGCWGRAQSDAEDAPEPAERDEPAVDQTGPCQTLYAPGLEPALDDLQIEYACGFHSATADGFSEFLPGGTPCESSNGINTFALKLTGSAASRYSGVVRCGFIRYDNGTFVGERVEVEARDGEWCHEPALKQIELVDRMLLTDVSFAIETTDAAAPPRHLAVRFSTRSGWTEPVPSETNLCAYVAHRQSGAFACSMAPAAAYCVCPCGDAWEDFFHAMNLWLPMR